MVLVRLLSCLRWLKFQKSFCLLTQEITQMKKADMKIALIAAVVAAVVVYASNNIDVVEDVIG